MKPHEKFAAHRPRVGDQVRYSGPDHVRVSVVTRVEGNLCYCDGEADGLFIWAFADGVNALHDWPTKAGAKVARCPGVNC
jgi:hypothetical protein